MRKSDIKEVPEYYAYYIHLNDDVELSEAFEQSIRQIDRVDMEQLKRIGTQTYAEGKWSIHQIIQHVCDWERIWCYRTLVNVRREGNVPVGLDHNLMAGNSNADELPIDQLLGELRAVRLATCAMFQSFNQEILLSDCAFSDNRMQVLAMGFNIIGHQRHHFNIIRERYLPLDVK
ncbi:MAG: DinB family protein [Saprospiraceae bacterium]|nr:DinB family protein [Saprospiraceae bacterium]